MDENSLFIYRSSYVDPLPKILFARLTTKSPKESGSTKKVEAPPNFFFAIQRGDGGGGADPPFLGEEGEDD